MSEKMTTIHLPKCSWAGFMDYGEVDVATMIATVKRDAAREIAELQKVLDADPSEFAVEVVRGKIVQHHVKTLQKGRPNVM